MIEVFYRDELVTLLRGDCMEIMPTLDPVDLIFTSPPYNLNCTTKPGGGFDGLRKDTARAGKWHGGELADGYADHADNMPMPEYEQWQRDFLSAAWRLLTPNGALFYNHKPRPWLGQVWLPLRLNPGLPLRQIVIWARSGGVNYSPSHYVPTHEWIMVFAGDTFRLKSKAASGVGDVWYVPQEPSAHPAPFPRTLPARAIETVAPSTVLDPFAGSGTTLVAAKAAGVRAIGIEKSARYCQMAVDRLTQESLFAPAEQATQDPLFGVVG